MVIETTIVTLIVTIGLAILVEPDQVVGDRMWVATTEVVRVPIPTISGQTSHLRESIMEAYLEVNEENVVELNEAGIDCNDGGELTCEVTYDINHADPDVGHNSDDVQITSVTCDGTDVERFFDSDKLHEDAAQDHEDQKADHECEAAEAEMDRRRGL